MARYFIRTFDKEDKKGCICSYDLEGFREVVEMLEENNEDFRTWIEFN